MSDKLIKKDETYRNWIKEVGRRFRQQQIKAAVKVNSEMLKFYWQTGKDIHAMHFDAVYGSGFYTSMSKDLQELFPDVRSFSTTNLKYMKYFYELYPVIQNHPQVGDASEAGENRPQSGDGLTLPENRRQMIHDLREEIIFCIPWGHQKLLIDKCKGDKRKWHRFGYAQSADSAQPIGHFGHTASAVSAKSIFSLPKKRYQPLYFLRFICDKPAS